MGYCKCTGLRQQKFIALNPRGVEPRMIGASARIQNVVLINTSCLGRGRVVDVDPRSLTAEAVEGASLALESVDHIESSHSLPASVLRVGDGIADNVLQENLEHRAGLLVDETRDTLHTTTTSETANGGLGDALDVVAKNLPVTLGAALAETLTALTTSRHFEWCFGGSPEAVFYTWSDT